MISRLLRAAEGLAESYPDATDALYRVVDRLKRVSRDATMAEVVVRTLYLVIELDVTLDGRLVDVLAHLGHQYGITLAMHPILLVVVTLGSHDNPDRATAEGSGKLDALLSVVLEDRRMSYQAALNTIAILARKQGLDATADMAVDLMRDIAHHDLREQAQIIEQTRLAERPTVEEGDNLGWVVKLMLTLATVTTVMAVAGRLAGSLADLVGSLDGILGMLDGDP